MECEDSLVAVRSRKNLPQIFVQEVDETMNRTSPMKLNRGINLTSTPVDKNRLTVPAIPLDSPPPPRRRQQENGNSGDRLEKVEASFGDSGYHGHPDSFVEWDCVGQCGSKEKKPTTLWETLTSPSKLLRNRWKGRATFMEEEHSMSWLSKMGPQQVLRSLVLAVILASFGFAVLTYTRHVSGSGSANVNNKYKSIEFGAFKRSIKLEEEKLSKDIVDEKGNTLGGKKAAIQFGHDRKIMSSDELDLSKDSEPVNEKSRDVKDEEFRFASKDDGSNVQKKRDVNDEGFRYASEDDGSKVQKKRDIKVKGFRHVSEDDGSNVNI